MILITYFLRKPLIRRDKGDTLSLLVQFLLINKPWVPCAPLPASLLLYRLSGLATTGPTLSFVRFFLFLTQVSPVSHMASTTLVRFLARLRLSSALPNPVLVPVPILVPISATVTISVPVPILRSFVRLPLSRSRFRSIPVPDPVPTPDSDPAPDPVRSFSSLGPGYPLGAMRDYRHLALRTELSGRCPQALPPVCSV